MKLRPHHLLCTQGYGGKGYSDEFVRNMNEITAYLRNETNSVVDIVFSTDDICAKCPNMLGVGLCADDEKVKRFDQKVVEHFGIVEKRYVYREIVAEIDSKMTERMMDDICSDCAWYPVSACKSKICNAK